ncbi:MAG TPA: methyltransferase domain-containing protein [Candidatus Limnocylindrales bacterium]|jgi:2-polyprenyl-3-methyl-5-hydroxy-6-metoxy-1,4-benzoquinol methylase|nr:methyltransferase domain-containing protein [Candidatus Limnocylindrales bacterium]
MFLSRRSMQAEYFDAERPAIELAHFFKSLGRVNRFFAFAEPFQRLVPRRIGTEKCQSLSILDLGAGDGTLGNELNAWARRRNWNWHITNLDHSLPALRLNPTASNVAASATALPFHDNSFDLVIASQMAHHLADEQVIQLLRESWRVARLAIFVSDLHRTVVLYSLLWILLHIQGHTEVFCADGLLSVKRSWRVPELKQLAAKAGLSEAYISVLFGTRVILEASKLA